MKRKIVAQGIKGRTVFLPIEWVRKHNLEAGDEIDLQIIDDSIKIIPPHITNPRKSTTIELRQVNATSTRMIIANAYRAGYDSIELLYDGAHDEVSEIVRSHIMGFEVTKTSKGYLLESMGEPSHDNFDAMVLRMFYLLSIIVEGYAEGKSVVQQVHDLQRYDNFLKRCIVKGVYKTLFELFLWQFLSQITQVGRIFYHFEKDYLRANAKMGKEELQLLSLVKDMIETLRMAYTKRDLILAQSLHVKQEKIKQLSFGLLGTKRAIFGHYIHNVGRQIYLAHSPLLGMLEKELEVDRK